MTATITPSRYAEFIRTEYLEGFIRDGGAAIKFCVPMRDQARLTTSTALCSLAAQLGYILVKIDASNIRINLIDQLLFSIARQIDWRAMAERIIERLCEREGYKLPESLEGTFFERVAEKNGLGLSIVKINLERALGEQVSEQSDLAKDFRTAMTQLCLAQMRGGADAPLITQVLIDWLTGSCPNINTVKRYQIFTRVTRTNARRILESVLQWIVIAGFPGTVILLDITRLAVAKNPRDERIYYTRPMLYDAFEVLREFVDATDRLTHCFMAVLPDASFLDESSGRGIGLYQALKLRITDDVRARERVNPMAPLVRISVDGIEAQ